MDEASVRIEAAPEQVWAMVSDVTRMGRWSPGNTGAKWIRGATGPAVGARFIGFNKRGPVRWANTCKVVECQRPGRFAFEVDQNHMRWGFRIDPAEGGATLLTQWRDRAKPPAKLVQLLATVLFRGQVEQEMVDGMKATLAAVKAEAEAAPVG